MSKFTSFICLLLMVSGLNATTADFTFFKKNEAMKSMFSAPSRPFFYNDGNSGINAASGMNLTSPIVITNKNRYSSPNQGQTITVNQKQPYPIVWKGWSKPGGNITSKGLVKIYYSLMIDPTYTDGKKALPLFTPFDCTNPDAQFSSQVFFPEKPVKSLKLFLKFCHLKGKAEFYDIAVGYYPFFSEKSGLEVQNGKIGFSGTVNNPAPDKSYSFIIEFSGLDGRVFFKSNLFSVTPGEKKEISLTCSGKTPQSEFVNVDIVDAKTGEKYFRRTMPLYINKISGGILYQENGKLLAVTPVNSIIYPDSIISGSKVEAIKITAARGEYEVKQLALNYDNPVDASFELDLTLNTTEGKKSLYYKVDREIMVNAERTSGGILNVKFPDRLSPIKNGKPEKFAPGANGLWLTVKVPQNALPGDYSGKLNVKIEEKTISIPFKLHVFSFALPEKPSLSVWPMFSRSLFIEKMPAAWRDHSLGDDLYRNFSEHRCDMTDLMAMPEIKVAGTQVTLHQKEEFRENIELAKKYGIKKIRIPLRMFGASGRTVKNWQGLKIPSEEFSKMINNYSKLLTDFIKSNYPEAELFYEPYDEPKDINHLKYICDNTRQDELKIFCTVRMNGKNEYEHLKNQIDVFCPHPIYENSEFVDNIKKIKNDKTKKLYLYHNHLFFIDSPRVNARLFPWIGRYYKADGLLFWSINYWKPYLPGRQFQYTEAILLYPGTDGKLENSVRWEMFREGYEDIEYLKLLEAAIKELPAAAPSRLEACKLLRQANAMVSNWQIFDQNYSKLEKLIEKIGFLIDRINKNKTKK